MSKLNVITGNGGVATTMIGDTKHYFISANFSAVKYASRIDFWVTGTYEDEVDGEVVVKSFEKYVDFVYTSENLEYRSQVTHPLRDINENHNYFIVEFDDYESHYDGANVTGVKYEVEGYSEDPRPTFTVNINANTDVMRGDIFARIRTDSSWSSSLGDADFYNDGNNLVAEVLLYNWRTIFYGSGDIAIYVQGPHRTSGMLPKGYINNKPYFGVINTTATLFENKNVSIVVEDIDNEIYNEVDFWNIRYATLVDVNFHSDIDMYGFTATHIPTESEEYGSEFVTPPDYYFKGSIEGNGYTIRNLTQPMIRNLAPRNSEHKYIRNLNLENCHMTAVEHDISEYVLNYDTGMLCAKIAAITESAEITNCHIEGSLTGIIPTSGGYCDVAGLTARGYGEVEIKDCTVDADIIAKGDSVSACGLVAWGVNSFENCYHKGLVKAEGIRSSANGLFNNAGEVVNCFHEGSLISLESSVAGLGEIVSGDVIDCYAKGDFDGTYVNGGLVYVVEGNLENCYFEGTMESSNYSVEGLVSSIEGNAKNCYVDAIINAETTAVGMFGTIDSNAVIENCYVTKNTELYGKNGAVGFANRNRGIIKNCYSRAKLRHSDNYGTVTSFVAQNSTGDAGLINNYYVGDMYSVGPAVGMSEGTSCFYYNTSEEEEAKKNYGDGFGIAKSQITPYFDKGNKPGIGITWGRYWKRVAPIEETEELQIDSWENRLWYEVGSKIKLNGNYFECVNNHLSLENSLLEGWDFDNIWGIYEDRNEGFPTQEVKGVDFDYINIGTTVLSLVFEVSKIDWLIQLFFESESSFLYEDNLSFPIVRTNSASREGHRLYFSGTLLDAGPYKEELWDRKISGFFQYASEMFDFDDFAINDTFPKTLPVISTTVTSANLVNDIDSTQTEIELTGIPAEFEPTFEIPYKYLMITNENNKTEIIGYTEVEGNLLKNVDRGILDSIAYSFTAGDLVFKSEMEGSLTFEDDVGPIAKRTEYKYRAAIEVDTELSTTGESKRFTFYGGEMTSPIDDSEDFDDLNRGELFLDARDLEFEDQLLDRAKLKFEEMEFESWNTEEFKNWVWDEFSGVTERYFENMTLAELIKIAAGITDYTEQDLVNNYDREEIEEIISDKLDVVTADEIDAWAFDVAKLVARLLTGEPAGAYKDWTEREVKDFLITMLTNEFSFGDFEDTFPFEKWETMMRAKLNISINNNASIEVEYNQYGPYNYMIDFNLGDIVVVEYPDVFRAMIRIIEVKEEHIVNEGKKYTLTLGKEFETLIGKLKSDKDSISGRL